ncbi:AfsR/SARP family transcriptional regulator [Streptomyces africanus]|uniref:AfsR/SARP family transcriptional regulator n=1 Tax=Streptomyces africanus TaxID=231024 RepID=UPI001FC99EE9|nr:BTAD domain-containing putative transcriptional regulator [Streptomyces africanus]
MRFGILGAIEVWRDGTPVAVGHARQRRVLAALLMDVGRTVPTDALLDRVWGEGVPSRGLGTLYGYVSRLRKALAPSGVDIVSDQGGYRLLVEPAAVDVHRFRRLADQARAADTDEHAVALWQEALELWRGEAFAGADTSWFNDQRSRLDAERLAAQIDLADARLRLGQHARLPAELSARAEQHPLDERVAGQLMLALYRCGRQAEALERFERARRQLAEEMGVDPGAPLRRLHQQILTSDPALQPAKTSAAAPATVHRGVVPRQLPAPPLAFVGRDRELAALDNLVKDAADTDQPLLISAIGGVGGIGKTWLALRWAHEHLDDFPDGQLYVNLRGFDPSGEPVPPQTAVRGFLDAFGTDPRDIPADPDAQVALYRSLTAGKQLLIVLDNARDTAQVVPLLPGGPASTVLVTSRSQLTGLAAAHGARPLALDALTDTEAHRLLVRHLGTDRVAAEPDATATLLNHCAGLPLGLSILAARATVNPATPLAELADELHEVQTRLDALDTGDITADLRTVFASSYRALAPDAARMFRLLGLAPGPDISRHAIASLTALPLARLRVLLRRLQDAHLVHEYAPGRYRMHDLIRLYAAERAREDLADSSEEALLRLVDFYLHTAHTAARRLDPHRDPIILAAAQPGVTPQDLADHGAALAWFTTEHPVLLSTVDLAVSARFDAHAWQLAWALETFFDYRGHWHDWAASQHTALDAAQRLGDRSWQAGAHRSLGNVYTQMDRLDDGHTHFSHALDLYGRLGDQISEAHTHRGLGWVCDRQGRRRDAVDHNEQALALYRQTDHMAGQAKALNNAGWLHTMLGDYQQALDYCSQAVALNQEIGDRHGEAGAWDSLGYVHHHLAEYTEAIDCYQRALGLDRGFGDRYGETEILCHLGDAHLAVGDPEAARLTWLDALRTAEEIGHPSIGELRGKLSDLARHVPEAGTGRRTGR